MFKVGDIVAPKTHIGRVVNITSQEITLEVTTSSGTLRYVKLTEEQARTRGLTLSQLAESALVVIGGPK